MTTPIHKHKRLFFIVFWSILTFSLWPYVYLSDHPFYYWMLYTAFVMASFIGISHYLSDIVLPKALKEGRMKHFLLQFFLGVMVLNILVSLCFTLFPYFIGDEQVLVRSDVQTWKELFISKLFNSIPSAMAIVTTTCGIRFYEEHHKIEQLNAKLKQEHLEAQIKLLQDQINPHLMFNVLNHIHILMQSNVELASTVLLKFSDILRYQLYECNQKFVFLYQEIQYLQDLVAIEEIRWQEELEVVCTWKIETKQLRIAPLLLVPLVENAFKHVSRLPHQQGYVHIQCQEEKGKLTLAIENSYNDTYKREKQQGGIGLLNITERLNMQYPNAHSFQMTQKEDTFTVVLQIDLHHAINHS
ncbi:sensor histidine kinase [Myroides fluvii]|uniref:sensor histidine kinase n=1 Tax=Myroides fluvii TaxID=2572594 RepID=UPI00131B775C|nr:histidine kinase [Myroides fluvii]